MKDLALLVLRATVGGLMAGHGAQKLFGSFGGPGLEGTAGWLKSLGFRPSRVWARAAALAEFGGSVLTVLGLLNPLGPAGILSTMAIAAGRVHWGKPIWVTEGGAELPVTNLAVGLALGLTGPGRYSLDRALGIRTPYLLQGAVLTAATLATVWGLASSRDALSRSRPELRYELPERGQRSAG